MGSHTGYKKSLPWVFPTLVTAMKFGGLFRLITNMIGEPIAQTIEGDSLVLGKALATQYYVLNNTLFKGEQNWWIRWLTWAKTSITKLFSHWYCPGLVYLNGNVVPIAPKLFARVTASITIQRSPILFLTPATRWLDLTRRRQVTRTIITTLNWKKKIGPIETFNLGSLSITCDANHYAYAKALKLWWMIR